MASRRQWALLGGAALIALALGFAIGKLRHQPGPSELGAAALYQTAFGDLNGAQTALAQWRGQVLVLNFWATWCPPCREEIPEFMQTQTRLGARGMQIVGIAIDDAQAVAAFVAELKINYPTLLGGLAGSDLARALGNRSGGLPFTVIVDRNGNVVAAKAGKMTGAELEAIVAPLF